MMMCSDLPFCLFLFSKRRQEEERSEEEEEEEEHDDGALVRFASRFGSEEDDVLMRAFSSNCEIQKWVFLLRFVLSY